MFDQRLREIWIALLLLSPRLAPGSADGPRPVQLDQEATVFIPPIKGAGRSVLQRRKDDGVCFSNSGIFDADHRHGFLLNPVRRRLAGYRAGFRFRPGQPVAGANAEAGSGSQTLFLYKRKGSQFSLATEKPLGDLAWDYFFTTPTSKGMQSGTLKTLWLAPPLWHWSRAWKKTSLDGAALARQPLRRDQPVVDMQGEDGQNGPWIRIGIVSMT